MAFCVSPDKLQQKKKTNSSGSELSVAAEIPLARTSVDKTSSTDCAARSQWSSVLIDMLLVSGYREDNECFTAAALAKVNSTINRRTGMDILRVRCHKCASAL